MASDTSMKGSVVEADAIAYYTKIGFVVSIPFTPTYYDLLVEQNGTIYRIQCKKARKDRRNRDIIQFRRIGCDGKLKEVDYSQFDYLYCLNDESVRYIIPASALSGKDIYLSSKYIHELPAHVIKHPANDNERYCSRCGKHLNPSVTFKTCDRCRDKAAASNKKRRSEKRINPSDEA